MWLAELFDQVLDADANGFRHHHAWPTHADYLASLDGHEIGRPEKVAQRSTFEPMHVVPATLIL